MMKLQRLALAMAGAGMLAATVASGPAVAGGQADPVPSWSARAAALMKQHALKTTAATAAGCIQAVGWPTAANVVE